MFPRSTVVYYRLTHLLMNLTDREAEVLYLIAHEYSNKNISHALFISANTVDTYRRKLFIKFGVKNAAGLIRRAFETRVMPMEKPASISNVKISA